MLPNTGFPIVGFANRTTKLRDHALFRRAARGCTTPKRHRTFTVAANSKSRPRAAKSLCPRLPEMAPRGRKGPAGNQRHANGMGIHRKNISFALNSEPRALSRPLQDFFGRSAVHRFPVARHDRQIVNRRASQHCAPSITAFAVDVLRHGRL